MNAFQKANVSVNWASRKHPYHVFNERGRCIGRLMPMVSLRVLAASPGIQSWSIPQEDKQ
jgi:hypothetical protein